MRRCAIKRTVHLIAAAACQSVLVAGFTPVESFARNRVGNGLAVSLDATPPPTTTTATADEVASKLLSTCAEYGQVGSRLSEEQRAIIDDIASSLSAYTDPDPARVGLRGEHELIYSASPGGSSGAVGPFVGKVTQSFLDETKFINRVELLGGLLKVELNAERQVLDGNRIRVKFRETVISLFGNAVKRVEAKGAGVWDYKFAGSVDVNGERLLLRVLNTPSTFVIVQRE